MTVIVLVEVMTVIYKCQLKIRFVLGDGTFRLITQEHFVLRII